MTPEKKLLTFKSEMLGLIRDYCHSAETAILNDWFIDEDFLRDMLANYKIFRDMYIQNSIGESFVKEEFEKQEKEIDNYKKIIDDFFAPPVVKEKTLFD
jgi:hypothetical protein